MPLLEHLALKKRMSALANPKSSIGRLDVFARVITDQGTEFDRIREGYKGPLYAEISPRAFSILVRTGSRLVQLRIRRGSPLFRDTALRRLHAETPLVEAPEGGGGGAPSVPGERDPQRAAFTVDVSARPTSGRCAQRAGRLQGAAPYRRDRCRPDRPLRPARFLGAGLSASRRASGPDGVVLDPNDFYILASREAVVVPPDHAAEMLPYDAFVGEFRVHYAGFFDPGFGSVEAEGSGSRAVLEVRSHEVPFLIEHGQVVGRMLYEPLIARPDRLYGGAIGSSYQRQGLALSKHFKKVAWGYESVCTSEVPSATAGRCRSPSSSHRCAAPTPGAGGRGGAAASTARPACGRSRSRRHRASLPISAKVLTMTRMSSCSSARP